MDERLRPIVEIIDTWEWDDTPQGEDFVANEDLAERLDKAGYRLDPYPNGKSKDELIKRIEAVEAERDALLARLNKRFRLGDLVVGPNGEQCVISAWTMKTKEHYINPDDNVQNYFSNKTIDCPKSIELDDDGPTHEEVTR